jgi:hypothetical protein
MDGIETKVYCPNCHKEVSLLLERNDVPRPIQDMMKALRLPVGNEIAYKGHTNCSCGKIVKVTFVMEAVTEDEQNMDRIVFAGGLPR